MSDEFKPIEIVEPGERYARIVGMLMGNKVKVIGWTPGAAVYVLDAKVYHVSANNIEIWDYFVFTRAWQRNLIEGYEVA